MKRWLICTLGLASVVSAQEGGIEVFAGETIFQGGYRVSLTEIAKRDRELFRGGSEAANPSGDEWTENRTVFGFDYGIKPDLQVSLLVPWVDRKLETGGVRSDVNALGDAAVLVKQRLYQNNWHLGSFNMAIAGGVELPTGEDDATTGGVRNPMRAQAGTGSWDSFLALSAVYETGRARVDGKVFYKANTAGAHHHEEGDGFTAQLTGAYRFYHAQYPGPTLGSGIGLKFQHFGRMQIDGVNQANSGGDVVFVHWSLSYHPIPRIDIAAHVDYPIYRHYNGTQLGRDLQLAVTFGIRF